MHTKIPAESITSLSFPRASQQPQPRLRHRQINIRDRRPTPAAHSSYEKSQMVSTYSQGARNSPPLMVTSLIVPNMLGELARGWSGMMTRIWGGRERFLEWGVYKYYWCILSLAATFFCKLVLNYYYYHYYCWRWYQSLIDKISFIYLFRLLYWIPTPSWL